MRVRRTGRGRSKRLFSIKNHKVTKSPSDQARIRSPSASIASPLNAPAERSRPLAAPTGRSRRPGPNLRTRRSRVSPPRPAPASPTPTPTPTPQPRRFHRHTPTIPQQKQIRAGSRIALASSRMRAQEQWRRSRKSPAAHQKARRRSSHFRKKFFRGKKLRASPRRNRRRRKRLQIQGGANLAATTPKMRAACVCALSRIHPASTASMTLACHVRAQLASNASDLQGVARHGSAPSLRSACDARGPAWCCRVIGDVLQWACSLQFAVSSTQR